MSKMYASVMNSPTDIPVYDEFNVEELNPGFVQVDFKAAGIHPLVRVRAEGNHYTSPKVYPHVPGVDLVGVDQDGDFVYTGFTTAPYGSFAHKVNVPENLVLKLPKGTDPVKVAASINPGLSSWIPIKRVFDETGKIDCVLILGATGMSGKLAVQNAKAIGAKQIIAAGRNLKELESTKALGADHIIQIGGDDEESVLKDSFKELSLNPDLVLDFLWGKYASITLDLLVSTGYNGVQTDCTYVNIGSSAGNNASLNAHALRSRRIKIIGNGIGSVPIPVMFEYVPSYVEKINSGQVVIETKKYPLADVSDAWKDAQTSSAYRVVLTDD